MRFMRLMKEVGGVPVGTSARIIRRGETTITVRWVWPSGTYLPNKPDTDTFTYREIEEYFRIEV